MVVTALIAAAVVGLVGLAVYLWVQQSRTPTRKSPRKSLTVKTIKKERGKGKGETKTKSQPEDLYKADHNLIVEVDTTSTDTFDWQQLLDMLRDVS